MKNIYALAFSLIWLTAKGQSSINASGGEAIGSEGNISYSIGQTVYQSTNASNGQVLPGVQQPYEWFISSVEDLSVVKGNINIYPNPSSEFFTLKTKKLLKKGEYKIFALDGKLVLSGGLQDFDSKILVNALPSSAYTLQIFENSKLILTSKIIRK